MRVRHRRYGVIADPFAFVTVEILKRKTFRVRNGLANIGAGNTFHSALDYQF